MAVHFLEFWFPIEEFELGRRATLKKVNDPFCFWRKMREGEFEVFGSLVFAISAARKQ